ncbi:MAG: biotin transporter BioY [Lachnospiraceae bacterium]|nr:biotin transporter BioY [Lachnospiraceae bacterium]
MDHSTDLSGKRLQGLLTTAVMTAVCCILGPLSIPIGPVPVSLQVVAVYLCVFVLGWKKGTVSIILYILLGLFGLPVFTGFTGGPAKLLGPTGGFIIGFVFLGLISGFLIEASSGRIFMQLSGMVLGLAVCYLFGTLWFMFLQHVGFFAALSVCVLPFLAFDAAKIIISAFAGNAIRHALRAAGQID